MYIRPIAGDPAVRERILANLSRKKDTLDTFNVAIAQRRLPDPEAEIRHEPYICLGCGAGKGYARKGIIGMVTYPLLRAAVTQLTGYRFTPQAYFAQSYENPEDIGPGAVIGIRLPGRKLIGSRDASASVAFKMWQWVDDFTNYQYEDEETARTKLWKMAEDRCPQGMSYLRGMSVAPTEPQLYPLQVSPDLHALLGMESLRQLVAEHFGLRLVLIDGNRLISENHLKWDHYSAWAI